LNKKGKAEINFATPEGMLYAKNNIRKFHAFP
jgi:hypothetical protein